MKIQIGRVETGIVENETTDIYPNKTRKYLLPCLKEYGDDFMFRLNNIYKIAAGIGDKVVDNCGIRYKKHLFILADATKCPSYFYSFITWIKNQPMYEDDYIFGNLQKTGYHMIILKLPEKYHASYERFKVGRYSRMYGNSIIVKFFVNPDVRSVLSRDKSYIPKFVTEVNKLYNTNLTPKDWIGELDLPPTIEEETFNHHLNRKNYGYTRRQI